MCICTLADGCGAVQHAVVVHRALEVARCCTKTHSHTQEEASRRVARTLAALISGDTAVPFATAPVSVSNRMAKIAHVCCVVVVQVRVRHPELLSLFARHADSKGKQAKLKSPNQLQELLDISRSILQVCTKRPQRYNVGAWQKRAVSTGRDAPSWVDICFRQAFVVRTVG